MVAQTERNMGFKTSTRLEQGKTEVKLVRRADALLRLIISQLVLNTTN